MSPRPSPSRQAGASTSPSRRTPSALLRLRNPALWWPNGLGSPALHDLTLAASVDGAESNRRTTRFGIRQFGYEYDVPLPFTSSGDACTQSLAVGRQQARYVRVRCLTRATDWGNSLWTLSVTDSGRPGTDLALHASATSSTTDGDDHGPGNVTDGDPGTRWSSAYQDDQWIRVDLGSPQSFDGVDLVWEQAYARTYVVQVSTDDSTWTDVKSVDNTAVPLPFNTDRASLQVEDFTARTARFVRINCGVRHTSWGNSLWSLSVIDSSRPGTDLALHKAATASTEESDHPAAAATDGSPDSRWSSQYEDHQWIQVDLGSAQNFDRVAILWEQAYPKTYVIQVSADGDTWTDVKSVDNSPVPLKISVNGVRVLARGGNWGWDELLRRMPAERMDAAVRMHRDMNFTMIRNWVGSVNREEFYASCDEHGILVWNDFPNAWAMDPPDHDAFNAIARDTVLRYRIHPCVVVWCGANEGDPLTTIDKGMRDAVEQQAPGILYQNNSAGGIITGGGPYNWVEPEKYYDPSTYGSNSFGFHTEIGMPVVSTAESMRNLVGDEKEWPIGGAWYYHDWSEHGNQAPQQYRAAIEARLGTATDLDDFMRQGAVRQLRERAQHVRGVERPPVGRRQRPHAVDVPPRLAQHRLADLRLRLRRQRHLLRCPHRLRAPARPGRPAEVAAPRGEPHAREGRGCNRHRPAARPRRSPDRRRQEGRGRCRFGLHRARLRRGLDRRPARSAPAAPDPRGPHGSYGLDQHLLAPSDPGRDEGAQRPPAGQALGLDHPRVALRYRYRCPT